MTEFLASPVASWVMLLASFAGVVALGFFIISKVRDRGESDELPASELLTNFQELHNRGGLSDAEYRTIKSVLAERLQEELKNNDESG